MTVELLDVDAVVVVDFTFKDGGSVLLAAAVPLVIVVSDVFDVVAPTEPLALVVLLLLALAFDEDAGLVFAG